MYQPNIVDSHHGFMDMGHHKSPENVTDLIGDHDEYEISKSGTDGLEAPSGDDQDPNQRPKKKRYHRHTLHQIQEMESFFKECPHPDDKQRKELGRRLGLEPLQIKFWFQNKRTQTKAQHERHENTHLRYDNEKLRAENIRCKEALSNAACPKCGGPASISDMSFDEHHLRIENARLREEIDRISGIAAKYVGKPSMHSFPPNNLSPGSSHPPLDIGIGNFGPQTSLAGEIYGAADLLRSVSGSIDADKPVIIELAVAAMEELIGMARAGEPLWIHTCSCEMLSEEEYVRTFPRGIGPKPVGFKSEASKESAVVNMNHLNLVEILMDVNRWSNMFASIVSRAMTVEILSTGVAGNYNGALQVMNAEFQVPSPLVPTRENYYVRYCKQSGDGTWAVVDVSLDNLRPAAAVSRCRRRPSGCLIQELPDGYSKVMWIEHVEVDDRAVHSMYKPLVDSGLAFGAKRWLETLDRQCERIRNSNISAGGIGAITSAEGRKSMTKLAERMVMSFCAGVGASTGHTWTTLSGSGADDVRVMTRKSIDDPGRPPGIILSAATSFWLPISPKRVFGFLRDENSRSEWDILSNGGLVQEMVHIATGRNPGNSVSLLSVNTSPNSSQGTMLILQESFTEPTGSYVVYAPVDVVAMNSVLNGGDPEYVALLPSGFVILPDGPLEYKSSNTGAESSAEVASGGGGGSLVTVAFQILVDPVPTAKLSLGSVATVNNLIKCTVERIKSAVVCGDDNA